MLKVTTCIYTIYTAADTSRFCGFIYRRGNYLYMFLSKQDI